MQVRVAESFLACKASPSESRKAELRAAREAAIRMVAQ
jgi:hypothetical protein